MPNRSGKNGTGVKDYPPDNVLHKYLLELAVLPLTVEQKLDWLRINLNLDIGKSKFFQLQSKFKIPSIRRPRLSPQEIQAAVIEEVAKDVVHANGPVAIKGKLQNKLVLVPRNRIRQIMQAIAPEGFDLRYPSREVQWIKRQPLQSVGPFREISADGHEKLNAQALQMGGLGLPIYGYRDKWSGMILKLCVLPDARKASALGHVFLDLVSEIGGIPIQMTTDKGPETGWQMSIQTTFREICAPDIDPDVYPPFVRVKSVRNIVIESFWRWLHEKLGGNLKEEIFRGKLEYFFQEHNSQHHMLFYWIFVPIVQGALDEYATWWNQHRVRKQNAKVLPSGHIPGDALKNCMLLGGRNYLIKVPENILSDTRAVLSEEVGSRNENLGWFDDRFAQLAEMAYAGIGKPHISLQNAWAVFLQMALALSA